MSYSLLLVEDTPDDAALLVRALERQGLSFTVQRVETEEAFTAALKQGGVDAVISDWSLPGFSAPMALKAMNALGIDLPFLIVSGTVGEEQAVEAMRLGAHDYVMKGSLARLGSALEREIREANNRRQRQEADLALQRSERRFRTLVECAPAMLLVHREGRIVYANPAVLERLGYGPGGLIGESILSIVHPSFEEIAAERLRGHLAGERSTPLEMQWLRKDVSPVWVESSGHPTEWDGAPAVLVLARDISAHKEFTAKLMQMDRMVAVGTLAAGVGHEINNPLAYVSANLEFLARELAKLRDGAPPTLRPTLEECLEVLQETREGAGRIRDVVADLRTLSRREERVEAVDLAAVIESALSMARGEMRNRAQVVKRFAAVPRVKGNASRLGQVFLNLLVNAAHAIAGRREREVRISLFEKGNEVVAEVADTGGGIAPEHLGRIFDPFFTTKPADKGTGLGLAICANIVREHGGRIEVESKLGEGTCFRVTLPAEPAAVAGAACEAKPGGRAGAHILFVDDEASLGVAVKRLLGKSHSVVTETRAADALARIEAGERFALIYCDLAMPEMTGMELYSVLHDRFPQLAEKMVFMTGGTFTDEARTFLERVKNPRLEKPFALEALEEQVQRALAGTA